MNLHKPRRQRGVIPTPGALKKLQAAILAQEQQADFEERLTQEQLSLFTGLARRTIRKVFNREGCVSLSTLSTLFSAFNLELQPSDYHKPDLHTQNGESASQGEPQRAVTAHRQTQVEWGEAIDVSFFCGRTEALASLTQWLVRDRCRLIGVFGMGGIGKTALSVRLAQQIPEQLRVQQDQLPQPPGLGCGVKEVRGI